MSSSTAPKRMLPDDWDPVYGWKPLSSGMDGGVLDIGREHELHWYSSSVWYNIIAEPPAY